MNADPLATLKDICPLHPVVAPSTGLVAAGTAAAGDPLLDRALGAHLLARNPPIRAAKRIVDALIEEEQFNNR